MGNVKITRHKKEVLSGLEKQLEEGCEICGMIVDGYAKENLTVEQYIILGG